VTLEESLKVILEVVENKYVGPLVGQDEAASVLRRYTPAILAAMEALKHDNPLTFYPSAQYGVALEKYREATTQELSR
jgi:hypothetical protein